MINDMIQLIKKTFSLSLLMQRELIIGKLVAT
jgi:hypothetical protein